MNPTLKGSSWTAAHRYAEASSREGIWPDHTEFAIGFRIAKRREGKTPTVRSGSWFLRGTNFFRCAFRDGLTDRFNDDGFRIARRKK